MSSWKFPRPTAGGGGGMLFRTREGRVVQTKPKTAVTQENLVQGGESRFQKVFLAAKSIEQMQTSQTVELESATMELAEREKKIVQQGVKIGTLVDINSSLQAQLAKRELEFNDMMHTLSQVQIKAEQFSKLLDGLKQDVENGEHDKMFFKKKFDEFQEVLAAAEQAQKLSVEKEQALQQKLAEGEIKEQQLAEKLDQYARNAEELEAALAESRRILDELQAALSSAHSKEQEQFEQITALNDAVTDITANAKEAKDTADREITGLKSSLEETKTKWEDTKAKLNAVTLQYDDVRKSLVEKDDELQTTCGKLTVVLRERDELRSELDKASAAMRGMETELKSERERHSRLELEFDLSKKSLLVRAEETEREYKRREDGLTRDVDRLTNALEAESTAKNAAVTEKLSLQEKVKQLDSDLGCVNKKRDEDAVALTKAQAEIATLTATVVEKESETKKAELALQKASAELQEKDTALSTLTTTCDGLKAELDSTSKEAGKKEKELKKELSKAKKDIDLYKTQTEMSIDRLRKMNEQQFEEKMKEQTQEFEGKMQVLQKREEELAQSVKQLEEDKSKAEDELKKANNRFKSQQSTHQDEIAALTAQVTNVEKLYAKNAQEKLDEQEQQYEKQLESLRRELEASEKERKKKKPESMSAKAKETIRECEAQVQEKTSKISELEKELQAVKQSLASQVKQREEDARKYMDEKKELEEKLHVAKQATNLAIRQRESRDQKKSDEFVMVPMTPVTPEVAGPSILKSKHRPLNDVIDTFNSVGHAPASVTKTFAKSRTPVVCDDDIEIIRKTKTVSFPRASQPLSPFPRSASAGRKRKTATRLSDEFERSSQKNDVFAFDE